MRKTIFPITIWALKRESIYLLNFCSSLAEAILYAKRFPFTPLVFAQTGEVPFEEGHISPLEYGEGVTL
jgi:hypothetical protein